MSRVERLVKLVRSGAGSLWRATGVEFRPIERDEHVRLLRQKLIEEAGEYVTDPSIGELADVVAVAMALAIVDQQAEWTDVLREVADRRAHRGDYVQPVALFMTGELRPGAQPDDQAVVVPDAS